MKKRDNQNNQSTNKLEAMLFSLPKNCGCNTCRDTKSYIKEELGDSKYKTFCREVGIVL